MDKKQDFQVEGGDIGIEQSRDQLSSSSYQESSDEEDYSEIDSKSAKPTRQRDFFEEDQHSLGHANSSGPVSRSTSQKSLNKVDGRSINVQNGYTLERIRADALQWASQFQGPREEDEARFQARRGAARSQSTLSIKRKQEFPLPRPKRLKTLYNNDYRMLLNSVIRETAEPSATAYSPKLEESQLGAVTWSVEEKDAFFTGLSRYGKDNVLRIAGIVRTKSTIEVRDYVCRLEEGLSAERLSGAPADFADFPIATQISGECCEALENAADNLALFEDKHESEKERMKWGESWLLTSEVNDWVVSNLDTSSGYERVEDVLPAATLLNLGKWLDLSAKIFMNPAPPHHEGNWRYIIQPDEKHGIRATAFEDFYHLAISITKRLLATTLYCTMSRLRARHKLKSSALIRAKDVRTAARTIGLKTNAKDFWRNCPRRCHLDVYRKVRAKNEEPLSYEVVEEILGGSKAHRLKTSEATSAEDEENEEEERRLQRGAETRSKTGIENSITTGFADKQIPYHYYTSSDGNESYERRSDNSSSPHKYSTAGEGLESTTEDLHDLYAEAKDTVRSLEDEENLWKLLKIKSTLQSDSDIVLPKKPLKTRRPMREENDWRDVTEFWSHWETTRTPVPEKAFAKNAKLRSKPRHSIEMDDPEFAPRDASVFEHKEASSVSETDQSSGESVTTSSPEEDYHVGHGLDDSEEFENST